MFLYLICERKGAVNVQPVISLQLQQRVSQQLLKEQRGVKGQLDHDLHVTLGRREQRSRTGGAGWLEDWVQNHSVRRGTKSQAVFSFRSPIESYTCL